WRPEDVRAIETHPDGPPPQLRVDFRRRPERRRELVPPRVVGADDHRMAPERLRHAPKVLGLLILGRQFSVPRDEEFRAQQAHALRPVVLRRLDLVGKIDVPPQHDADTVRRDGRLVHDLLELQRELATPERSASRSLRRGLPVAAHMSRTSSALNSYAFSAARWFSRIRSATPERNSLSSSIRIWASKMRASSTPARSSAFALISWR